MQVRRGIPLDEVIWIDIANQESVVSGKTCIVLLWRRFMASYWSFLQDFFTSI